MPYIDPRYNPFCWTPQIIGATIYWLFFSWRRRSLVEEIKHKDNQLWHGLISAALLLGVLLYLARDV